jgi:tellurite resistance protein TehA-like permease
MNGQPPRQRFPSWKQALLILCSGIVLGASSCALFLANFNLHASGNLPGIFAGGFIAGVIATIVGFLLVLIRAIRGSRSKS